MKKSVKWIKLVMILIVVALIATILGFSYAYWKTSIEQTGEGITTTSCFNINYSENTSSIENLAGIPQSDEEGLTNFPHTITITNTCDTRATYVVKMNVLNTSTLDDSLTRVGLGNNVFTLSDLTNTKSEDDTHKNSVLADENSYSAIANAKARYILASGELGYQKSVTYSIRTWLDEFATESQASGKEFHARISVESAASRLDSLLLKVLGPNKDNVSKDGSSLYVGKTDEDKDTYYFSGADEDVNNHLTINGLDFRIIRVNEDDTIRIFATTPTVPWRNAADSTKYRTFYSDSGTANSTYINYTDVEHYYTSSYSMLNWYKQNFENTIYNGIFVEGNFCNDTTYPTITSFTDFKCNVPTMKLKYGLMTINEFYAAGGLSGYLYRGTSAWTMTPYNATNVYYTHYNNMVGNRITTDGLMYTYPVLNIEGDTPVIGDGSVSNPYVVTY